VGYKLRKIIVDGDACPVKQEIASVAAEHAMPVIIIASIAHEVEMPGIETVRVDNIPQAADIAVTNRVKRGDIVVTQDYGLASLVLGKKAFCISPRGHIYTEDNIDSLLLQRHISFKERKAGIKTKGPKAFSHEDRKRFITRFSQLIEIDY